MKINEQQQQQQQNDQKPQEVLPSKYYRWDFLAFDFKKLFQNFHL